jgi:hypothetical protein
MKKSFLIFFILFSLNAVICFAQGLNPNRLPPSEATKYVQPLATYMGVYFNSGTYYTADVPETFGFRFSIIGMISVVPDDQKTFNPNPQIAGGENLEPTATVLGNKSTYFLTNKGYFVYPTGVALKYIPLGIYQIAGSIYNTELLIRFFPNSRFEDTKVGLFGFGIKHDFSSYIPLLPINLAVQILYNKLDAEYSGDEIDKYAKVSSSNFAFNVHASKEFLEMLTLYSGLQYENSSTDFGYYFDDPNDFYPGLGNKRQQITVKGKNHFRYTLGGAIKLAAFVINADMNVTSFTTFTLGLSLDI